MKRQIKAGTTSKRLLVFIQDSSQTDGRGLTGLVFNSAGLTAYYKRDSGSASVSISLVTITTLGTYASGGFREVDATNMPGLYEFHPPDAALAAGAESVAFELKGATNMVQLPIEVELTAQDMQDAVRGGMTALPNANAAAAGGLLTFGTGAGQIDPDGTGRVKIGDALQSGVARANFMFVMTDSTNHAPKAGLGNAITCTRNIDGAGFAAGTITNVSEIGNGWYKCDLGAGDLGSAGSPHCIAFRFTAAASDDLSFTIFTQP